MDVSLIRVEINGHPAGAGTMRFMAMTGYGHFTAMQVREGRTRGLDLHLTREKLRELLRALEEKQRLMELLDRFLEMPAGEQAMMRSVRWSFPTSSSAPTSGSSSTTRTAGWSSSPTS